MRLPAISVLMPVYNAQKYIKDAVDSILNQAFTDFEFIIINDGSTDSTLKILEDYAQQDSRILLVSRENKGLVDTLNEGITLAQAQLIARMDADDIALPERFSLQYKYLQQHPKCLVVGGRSIIIDPDGDSMAIWNRLTGFEDIQSQHLNSTRGSAIAHPSMMYRKDAVQAIGGYRTECFPAEDLDLLLRISEHGTVENIEDVVLMYREHGQSICASQKKIQMGKTLEVVNMAREKRGLTPLTAEIPTEEKLAVGDDFLKWGWWALKYGNLTTARKYAKKVFLSSPFSLEVWRFLYCVLRGR